MTAFVINEIQEVITPPETFPVIPVYNIHVEGAGRSASGIWQVPVNQEWTITADVALPDGTFMLMTERMVNGITPVDDERFLGTVASGKFTLKGKFFAGGNYMLTPERLNMGLEREKLPFRLSFEKVDFDAYRVV